MTTFALDDQVRTSTPYWSAYTEFDGGSSPSDPLRFEMYAQRLGNHLLPGITNRTERLRYLSMVCAGLELTASPGASIRAGREAFLPFERGWALAMAMSVNGSLKGPGAAIDGARALLPEYRGLRGVNAVLRHFRSSAVRGQTSVRPSNYRLLVAQAAQGGLGVYLVLLREFGFVAPGSLALTASGLELARAFVHSAGKQRRAKVRGLASHGPVKATSMRAVGHRLAISHPSEPERELVRSAIFDDERRRAACTVRRILAAVDVDAAPEQMLAAIADPNGDEIAHAAAYAVAFDPMRLAALRLFARIGRALEGAPGNDADVATLLARSDEADSVADLRETAATLAGLRHPPGLEPVGELARRLAEDTTAEQTVSRLVDFHRQEERRWIVPSGRNRLRLGVHGRFADPAPDFHGYTVHRAFQIRADIGDRT